jgi:alkylated DNA nucleotide flippase Atl1
MTQEVEEAFLRAGVGIDGDCNARPTSPRQVLLAATGTYERFDLAPKSLRENILIRIDELALSSGSLLLIGSDVALRISFECEPCGRLNRIRPRLARDIKGRRGYLARVVRSGVVRRGDKVQVVANVFRPFPDEWRDRVISVARMLPSDHIMSYARLAELAGVPRSYCRTFPRLLRSQPDLPWQRVVSSDQLTMSPNAPKRQMWLGSAVFGDELQFS